MGVEQDGAIAASPRGGRRGAPAAPEAAPLAQESRKRIAQALSARPEGLTAHEIAGVVGLHHTVVREHLAVLARAGMVNSARGVPTGRPGRPSIRHRLTDADGVGTAGHRELVRLLMMLARRAGMNPDDVEEVGREEGRLLARPGGADEMIDVLAFLGFAPEERTSRAGRELGEIELRLRHCPFREAVLAPGGELVCRLHRGLSAGLAEGVAEGAALSGFEPKDPRRAGCRVSVRGLPPRPEAPRGVRRRG